MPNRCCNLLSRFRRLFSRSRCIAVGNGLRKKAGSNMYTGAGIYLVIGLLIARKMHPMVGHNFVVTTLLWPWPVAAEATKRITGKYPSWTPPV